MQGWYYTGLAFTGCFLLLNMLKYTYMKRIGTMKQKAKQPKNRNPVAAYAKRSGAGVHVKSNKAMRRKTKTDLLKERT